MNVSRPRTAAELFLRTSDEFSNEPALLASGVWITFGELGHAARHAVELLAESGAAPGDRVILYLQNSAVLRIIEHGIVSYGLVRVCVSPRLHAREVAAIARDCRATIVCCDPKVERSIVDCLTELGVSARVVCFSDTTGPFTPGALLRRTPTSMGGTWRPPLEEDPAMIIYSSGTTGEPKGAIVTQRGWVAHASSALAQMPRVGPGDVVLAVAPMSYFGGSIGLDCAVSGAATVPMSDFSVADLLSQLVEHNVTILPLAPIMLKELVDYVIRDRTQVPGLKAVPYGGSSVSADVLVNASKIFPGSLFQFYGLSEALAPLSCLSARDHDRAAAIIGSVIEGPDRERAWEIIGSAGRLVSGVEMMLRVEDLTSLDDVDLVGQTGEVVVRAETVMPGYWERPELTAAVLDSDGWFATGDIGALDTDGFLHILDRKSDLIISGGFNVHPGEVERVLRSVNGVRDVAVVSGPHPRWGEGVHAFVVPESIAPDTDYLLVESPDLVRRMLLACGQRLASYKKPISFHFVTDLPQNAAGKTNRRQLRSTLWTDVQDS